MFSLLKYQQQQQQQRTIERKMNQQRVVFSRGILIRRVLLVLPLIVLSISPVIVSIQRGSLLKFVEQHTTSRYIGHVQQVLKQVDSKDDDSKDDDSKDDDSKDDDEREAAPDKRGTRENNNNNTIDQLTTTTTTKTTMDGDSSTHHELPTANAFLVKNSSSSTAGVAVAKTGDNVNKNHLSTTTDDNYDTAMDDQAKQTVAVKVNNHSADSKAAVAKTLAHNKSRNYRSTGVSTNDPKAVPTTATPRKRVLPHYVSHIPKTGATFAFRILGKLLQDSEEYKQLPKHDRFRDCEQNPLPGTLDAFHEDWIESFRGVPCTIYMSENPYDPLPQHIYTIVRDPYQHIISQYFHCTESKIHAPKAKFMPKNITEWLEAWVDEEGTTIKHGIGGGSDNRFKCYDPRNLQSHFLSFYPKKDKHVDQRIFAKSIDDEDNNNDSIDSMMEDLSKRYDVIGDNAQMAKTICLIFIRYTGWVPPSCDCTLEKKRRHLLQKFDHGVKHHGASFQTTPYQESLLAKLTKSDRLLYKISKQVFEKQVQQVETEYNITICNNFRTDVQNPITGDPNHQFTHFLSHIPSTGGNHLYLTLDTILRDMPEWKALTAKAKEDDDIQLLFRPCDEGMKHPKWFQNQYKKKSLKDNIKCTMWKSQQPYDKRPEHIYTIVRDPHEHVISQYIQCLSRKLPQKKDAQYIKPSNLTHWLETWVDALENKQNSTIKLSSYGLDERFNCFDPRNLQSHFVQFHHPSSSNTSTSVALNDDVMNNTSSWMKDLHGRYDVIGDNAQMDKSICLIIIKYTGWVPEQCNCIGQQSKELHGRLLLPQQQKEVEQRRAASLLKTTAYQDKLITKLTKADRLLYDISKKVFERQVKEVEDEYNIQVCNKFRTDIPSPRQSTQ